MSESSRDGVQSWAESMMSACDRIRVVAETLREPRSVNWISEQADAAWSTTNEELQALVAQGQLRRVEAGETTRYQPDYTRLLFEEIRTLIEENTREELRSELAAITEEIEEWQATYDVETWEELEQSLADGDLTSDELHERRDVITEMQEKAHGFSPVSYPYVGVSRKQRFGGSRGGRARAETHRKRDEIDARYGA